MLFIAFSQSPKNLNGVFNRRFSHRDGLEATFQSRITLDVFAVLVKGGGSDALKLSSRQGRLENVGGVDGSFSCTSTDQSVDFVDDEDHIACGLDLLHDFFEAFFKFTPVFRAGNKESYIEGQNPLVFEDVWNITLLNPLSEPFGNRCLADTWLADQNRVVLRASSEDLNHPIDFVMATNNRIKLGFAGELGEVVAELIKSRCFGGPLRT